jgi:hypothetical protein
MQSYLCIGGNHDGLNTPAHDNGETITMPVGVVGRRELYNRMALSLGDASIVVYVHESIEPEHALNLFVVHYAAWCKNRPGSRR